MIHTFKFENTHLVLDVESGALHCVDAPAFAYLAALEAGQTPPSAELGCTEAELAAILGEVAALQAQGCLFSAPMDAPAEGEGKVIKAICLHVAHDCNLRCDYCFAGTGEFCGERALMDAETGKRALDFLVERSLGRKQLEVDFFGGEPLMNLGVVRQIVAYGRELEKTTQKRFVFTVTTNGLALTDDAIDFFNAEMQNVVVSLDGRKRVHDALRKTVNGKGSYDAILPKLQRFIKKRGEREHYVRGTFTSANLDFTNDVKALVELGFRQISLEPVVLESTNKLAIDESMLPQIKAEYEKLCAFYQQRMAAGEAFNFFHFMLDMDDSPCLRKRVLGCGAGNEYVAIVPGGDIYPCHQFVGSDKRMGNIFGGEFDAAAQSEFARCNINTKSACVQCWAKYFCCGGCAANAYKFNADMYTPHAQSCELLKKRTELALGLYAKNAAQ